MSKVIATGSYLPANAVSNNEFIKQTNIDSSDEWITQRTGIKQRYLADEKETVADLASKAANDALSKVDENIAQEIELIIVATMSSRLPTPAAANKVQAAIGNTKAWGFDLNGACSGFVMALDIAEKMSKEKKEGYTLVIGAEKMSSILNFSDRSTSVLFGDGAGAFLIKHDGTGLPNYQSQLTVKEDTTDSLVVEGHELSMVGKDVFNFVNRTVIPSLSNFKDSIPDNFDYLIVHQANLRLVGLIVKKLKLTEETVPTNIAETGNVSAGSIPILLDDLVTAGQIKLDGSQKILVSGFGGGLAYGHSYFKI